MRINPQIAQTALIKTGGDLEAASRELGTTPHILELLIKDNDGQLWGWDKAKKVLGTLGKVRVIQGDFHVQLPAPFRMVLIVWGASDNLRHPFQVLFEGQNGEWGYLNRPMTDDPREALGQDHPYQGGWSASRMAQEGSTVSNPWQLMLIAKSRIPRWIELATEIMRMTREGEFGS